ncbi:MAG: hypothetical protein NZ528_05255 [Caldilineales bacterium]|nr:hypothetical protein [Caldilineales bacterium]MDW8318847.1 hypothetical protein [Anaerolineae bacterium]
MNQRRRWEIVLRLALLAVALLAGLLLLDQARSLFEVWRLEPNAAVPTPWRDVLNADRATQTTRMLALVGAAALGSAALASLVFVVERSLKVGWSWLQDRLS